MENILYIFISHKNNINKIYDRIKNNMNSNNNSNYIIVLGGDVSDNYDIDCKILSINCNDNYEGLPEKILKTYKYIVESHIFNQYTHFIKLDDDMIIKKIIDYNDIKNINYGGNVCATNEGDRKWHMGKCSKNCIWNTTPYKGIYTHWCKGGYGYIISRKAINIIKYDENYFDNIYEDLYIALTLKTYNIYPINIYNWVSFFISPVHK